MLQGFGSTEVCGIAHEPMPPRPRRRGSVGIPVGGEVRAIDTGGRTCGPGETGELVVRGPLVFDGYLDDPDLTARSFTGSGFAPATSATSTGTATCSSPAASRN